MNFGIAYLLTGKVASGKTTFARKKEAQENAVFLSIDELQLSMFGQTPTREQLDSTYEGARAYQFKQALKFLQKGIDVYFDWGLWSKAQRALYKNQLEKLGIKVEIIYFNIPDNLRLEWNTTRNLGDDKSSFKIETHDLKHFDSFYEPPTEKEYDTLVTA